MKLTSFFVKNPVASIVLNSMLIIMGIMCFNSLFVREYPKVNTSVVTVDTKYPNASPEVVETSITNILEDKLAGVEGVDTIRSKSSQSHSEIQLDFKVGVPIDKAVSYIRDAISLARDKLPTDVKEPTIIRSDSEEGGLPFIGIAIESETMGSRELTHYANMNIKNVLRSISGVSGVQVHGPEYTYNVRLDPKKLCAFGVNVDEIFNAINASNKAMPVGKFRDAIPTTLNTELKTKEDFEKLTVKNQNFSNPNKKQYSTFLKDVAEISLGTSEDFRCHINGKPGVAVSISKSSDSNPVEVSKLVNQEIENIKKSIPGDIKISTIVDQAMFVRASIKNIQHAAVEAIFLVLGIVFLFLRNVRATIIPLVTIPISLLGSLLFLNMCGFSINTMTLLAMVLAVGLVVDDAIVVLENISRHIESGKTKLKAALDGAGEIGKAIVAVTLTLVSVYAPFAFIQGAIGQLFIEFAVALAGSVLISGIVALTLSPLMCSVVLKKNDKNLFPALDTIINGITEKYKNMLDSVIHHKKLPISIASIALILTVMFFMILPKETAPKEDRGMVGVYIPMSGNKDLSFCENQIMKVEKLIGNIPETSGALAFIGSWGGYYVLPLVDKSKRSRAASNIVKEIYPKAMMFPSQEIYPWSWDSNLPGLSDDMSNSGVEISVSTTESYQELYKNLEKVKTELAKDGTFINPIHNLNINNLTYKIDVDNNAAAKLGISNGQIARTIEVFFSNNKYLTFQKDGIEYAVTLKGCQYPWDLSELYITNSLGKRISLSAIAKMKKTAEPSTLRHYNQMRSATISMDLSDGVEVSYGLAKTMKVLDEVLPKSYKKIPIGATKNIESSSNTMLLLFVMALVFIFAILSLQFNNFMDPILILVTVPLACSGALFTIWMFGISLNIYTQVGLITLIGLITKHGILIVEFINQLMEKGMDIFEATKEATSLRLRPILITTGAMVFGSLPLVLSHDSGYEARQSIGYVLIGGLMFGTVFTLFILPTLCCIFKKKAQRKVE